MTRVLWFVAQSVLNSGSERRVSRSHSCVDFSIASMEQGCKITDVNRKWYQNGIKFVIESRKEDIWSIASSISGIVPGMENTQYSQRTEKTGVIHSICVKWDVQVNF